MQKEKTKAVTLLKKAKTTKGKARASRSGRPDEELVELAVAWLRGDIRNMQLTEALERKPHNLQGCVTLCMNALRRRILAKQQDGTFRGVMKEIESTEA